MSAPAAAPWETLRTTLGAYLAYLRNQGEFPRSLEILCKDPTNQKERNTNEYSLRFLAPGVAKVRLEDGKEIDETEYYALQALGLLAALETAGTSPPRVQVDKDARVHFIWGDKLHLDHLGELGKDFRWTSVHGNHEYAYYNYTHEQIAEQAARLLKKDDK